MTPAYVLVQGYIHPESGDDRPFLRGFTLPKGKDQLENFKQWFVKNKMRSSVVKTDVVFRLVSKKEYSKYFTD